MSMTQQPGGIRAWHGTAYDFDRFENRAIGSGEGAQVYGHGHYVAEDRSITEWYRKTVTQRVNQYGTQDAYSVDNKISGHDFGAYVRLLWELRDYDRRVASLVNDPNTPANILKDIETQRLDLQDDLDENYSHIDAAIGDKMGGLDQDDLQHLVDVDNHIRGGFKPDKALHQTISLAKAKEDWVSRGGHRDREFELYQQGGTADERHARLKPVVDMLVPKKELPGRLYELNLKVDPDKMLDWDETLDNHHPEVLKILDDLGIDYEPSDEGGEEIYRRFVAQMRSPEAASKALLEAGIHGIRYRDANSRSGGPGQKIHVTHDNTIYTDDDDQEFPEGPIGYHLKLLTLYARGLHRNGAALTNDAFKDTIQDLKKAANNFPISHPSRHSLLGAAEWAENNKPKIERVVPRPNYNYVIFDPNLIEHVRKFDMNNRLLKDYGAGVHLRPVDHDPFKGT